uniref:CDC14 cell division cycle 14 homolog A, b n=1 Tax=Nothobranchius pienaari TaxID=704102 RepID=A0A1A8QCI4_9TELE
MNDLSLNNHNREAISDHLQEGDLTDGLTQGDKLRALKSRRPPRQSSSGALRVDEMKIHGRSPSPLRLSMGAGQGPTPILKSSKFLASSASAAAKRIGRNSSSTASNIRSLFAPSTSSTKPTDRSRRLATHKPQPAAQSPPASKPNQHKLAPLD